MQYQTKIDIVSVFMEFRIKHKAQRRNVIHLFINRYLLSIRSYNHVKIACNAST